MAEGASPDSEAEVLVDGFAKCTACLAAAVNGHAEVVTLLVEHRADLKRGEVGGRERTPLHAVVASDDPLSMANDGLVKLLISLRAEVDAEDGDGRTALHAALEANNAEMVELLLDLNADVTAKDNSGMNSIHIAAKYGATRAMERMSDIKGPQISYGAPNLLHMDWTPLHYAAEFGHIDVVQLIVGSGAVESGEVDVNAKDSDGATPLHIALAADRGEPCRAFYETLRDKGANVDAMDHDGETPRQLFRKFQHEAESQDQGEVEGESEVRGRLA